MEKNDTTASPKLGILLTNSGIFGHLRNFDFVFLKLRNSFFLARQPCGQCQQNFDSKMFLRNRESRDSKKSWIWCINLDFVLKFALVSRMERVLQQN